MKKISFLAVLLFVSVFPSSAHASTTFNGTITGDVVWTKADSPYIVNYVSIPQGASLTMLPGTIVKIVDGSNPFIIDGILTIGSASGEGVYITSMEDDAVGGDTNADGSTSSPQAGNWNQFIMHAGSTVTLTNIILRYGGATPPNYWTGGYFTLALIENNGGVLTIDHAVLAQSGYYGIRQFSGTTTVTNSAFAHVGNWGIYSTQGSLTVASSTFDTMERGVAASGGMLELGGNTFMHLTSRYAISVDGLVTQFINHGGNSGEGGILLGLSIDGDCALPKDGLPYIAQYTHVNSGGTLTILPGAIVKVSTKSNPFIVDGTLTIGRSGAERVYITSMNDDSVGGDTNGDGTTTVPQSGDWHSILFNSGSVGTITNATLRYGGLNEYSVYLGYTLTAPMIENDGGALAFIDAVITNGAFSGIKQTSGTTTILNSEIAHTSYGVYLVGGTATIHDSSIHDNSASGISNTTAVPIDATNNYWGNPSGPTHTSNPGGTGDRVSDGVSFTPWLGAWPTTTDPCVGVVNCYSNVLFLPGIESSRLYRPDHNGGADQLWEPNTSSDVADLYLDKDGKSIRDDIYTKDVIDEKNVLPIGQGNIYKSFLADMKTWESTYHIIATTTPYDWRLSLDDILTSGNNINGHIYYSGTHSTTTTPYIIQQLRFLASKAKTGKVTIIAHSNGGLVAKALVNKLGTVEATKLIDKIIFVAVPQVGTPEAIGALLHGYDQGLPFDSLPIILTPETARTFASTSPMAYQLLPSAAYFNSNGSTRTPMVTFDAGALTQPFINAYGHAIGNSTELHNFLLGSEGRMRPTASDVTDPSVLDPTLLAYGEGVHQALDDNWVLPPSITLYQIAGWGMETVGGIRYSTSLECTRNFKGYCLESHPKLEYTPEMVVDGDGTVVTPSALTMSTSSSDVMRYWVDLRGYGDSGFLHSAINRKHADILEVPELRNFTKNILTNSTATPTFISITQPTTNTAGKRLFYFLHSPLALAAHDNFGNEISAATSTIPGAEYRRFGEVQYISLPASTDPTLVLTGLAQGSFTLEVQEVTGDTVTATTTFAGIPSSTSTIATMNFPDGTIANAGALAVDEDGNGAIDFSLTSKLGGVVTLPPPPIYRFSGFLQPINDTTINPAQSLSVFKGGSTIPVKFQLKNASGMLIQASSSPVWLTPQKLSPMSAAVDESSYTDSGTSGNAFKWDSVNQQYIYNWNTKGTLSGYWYRISTQLDDGKTYSVTIGLR